MLVDRDRANAEDGGDTGKVDVRVVGEPDRRHAEHDVASGTTFDRGHDAERQGSEYVEAAAPDGQDAGNREPRDADTYDEAFPRG